MKYETANDFWTRCLGLVIHGCRGTELENPAIAFTKDAKAGMFDSISDEEYFDIEMDIEQLSSIWNGCPSLSAAELAVNALAGTSVPPESLESIAGILSDCSAISSYGFTCGMKKEKPKGARDIRRESKLDIGAGDPDAASDPRSLYALLDERIRGQESAKKAASMIVFDHLSGRRSNSLFYGPSGCGKSEIWRRLSAEFPGLITIVDASRLSADGWKGSIHLRDIFEEIPKASLKERGAVIVLDEADKILCETIVSGSGTDHSALIQNTLLKMLDGDALYFGNEGVAQEAFSVDCSKVSVVLLGAFEKLHQKKDRANAPSIGFAAGPRDISETAPSAEISYDDLISSGMRREIAGRINRLVALEELSVSDYETILEKNLLGDLEKGGRKVVIDGAGVRQLAEEAASSGLGVRYMLSRVIRELDELVFADPKAESYKIQF